MSNSGETPFSRAYREAIRNWATHHNNLSLAYDNALGEYHQTLEDQKEADRAAAERSAQFAMLALSLAGGSLLGTLFGKTALKSVAGDFAKNTALDTIVKNNMNNAFRALSWTDSNAAAKFVMGKMWDEAGGKISSEFEAKLMTASKGACIVGGRQGKIKSTLAFITPMKNFINNLANAVNSAEKWISNSGGGEKRVEQLIRVSPFFRKPPPIFVSTVEKEIELSFWMKYILDQDYIEKGHSVHTLHGSIPIVDKRISISQMPNSPNYPKNTHRSTSARKTFSDVKYKKSGNIVFGRINYLLAAVGIKSSEAAAFVFRTNKNTLVAAKIVLNELADRNKLKLRAALPK